MKNVLLIDNYDSFTHTIAAYIEALGANVSIYKNDEIAINDIYKLKPTHILISPGPGSPNDSGISQDVIKTFYKKTPILGVCLGHQCIGVVFGAKICRAQNIVHGKVTKITHNNSSLFEGIRQEFSVTRYHSLALEKSSIPNDLQVIARSADDEIMAIRHKKYATYGIQYHPEAHLTEYGYELFNNFLACQ